MTSTADPHTDRLYQLLPAIYRMRDAPLGYPLEALLGVISEQVNVVQDDIVQLYANWFIETAEDWVVPYIAELVGYRPVLTSGESGSESTAEGRALQRVLVPRREVANTIRYRRRKGTLALLEQLTHDIGGWPARPVEFFRLLGWNQNVNHLHLRRARTVDVRRMDDLDLLDGPFERTAHSADLRRVNSRRTPGRYNIPSVGLFVWRLRSFSVTRSHTHCDEDGGGAHCFTFSVLGQDGPLFASPAAGAAADPDDIPGELGVPIPIRRRGLLKHPERYYGESRSFAIWADGWAGNDADTPVSIEAIVAADLTDWRYVPAPGHVAVDPVLGRMAFPPKAPPKKGVRATYHYGFPAAIGGGEYDRPVLDPTPRLAKDGTPGPDASFYRIGKRQPFTRITDALAQWRTDSPQDAVIELTDSGVYAEPLEIVLGRDQTLQVRAANRVRPVLRLLDWQTDLSDALSVVVDSGSRFTLDGLLITGRGVLVSGPPSGGEGRPKAPVCGSEIVIRHCTLVPGWGIDCDCRPLRPTEASIGLTSVRSSVRIEHSIVGSIEVQEEEAYTDPVPITITDSIVDATSGDQEAIGGGDIPAHAILTVQRATIFGIVDTRAVALAENSIFNDCVHVVRRQIGCMRFCYVPPECRTPRRYHCQPDLVIQEERSEGLSAAVEASEVAAESLRVKPQFTDRRYGRPAYAQLGANCASEIKTGADDESEMGVYHDLFEPQRAASLAVRLDEFTPAAMNVGIIFAT